MDFRAIRQSARIAGVNRNPGATEHECAFVWDNNILNPDGTFGQFKYVSYTSLSPNSKTVAGSVAKGDDAAAGSYIWKLDASKNPAWRSEEYLKTVVKSGDDLLLTMNSGTVFTVQLGSLAWLDSLTSAVTSVFGRTGAVTANTGDYTAAKVTNAFDKTVDDLDDIIEGITNKHFTAAINAEIILNSAARHTHSNKAILDLITDAGGGIIPSAGQILEWDTFSDADAQNVTNTIATSLQANTGISWDYNPTTKQITPTIALGDFTTDNLPEGSTNFYFNPSRDKVVFTLRLPVATTVQGRCDLAVEGTDYPTGWTISAGTSEVDLLVTHNLNRKIAAVTVYSTDAAGDRQLYGNAAYSGILAQASTPVDGELLIEALATISKPIIVHLIFGDSLSEVVPIVPPITLPTIITTSPYSISSASFYAGGIITSDGNDTITEAGICFSLTPEPTTGDNVNIATFTGNSFTVVCGPLDPETVYYFRAYAINSYGTSYGNQFWFTSAPELSGGLPD